MPQFGNIIVPDNLIGAMSAPRGEAARPGFGELLGDASKRTFAQLRYGLPLEAKTLSGELTPEDKQFYEQGLAAAQGGAAPASVDDMLSGRVGVLRTLGENFVASLPSMAGMVAGGIAGAATAGPAGAIVGGIAGGIPQFVGSNVDRAVQENPGGLSYDSAVKSALIAPAQSGADALLAAFAPGAGRFLGGSAALQTGGFIQRTVTGALKGGATEAVTEAAQQAGERWAAGKPLDNVEAAKEYVSAAVIAFGIGGVIGGAGGAVNRQPADSKPAEMVTTEDLLDKVSQITAPRTEPLALPAPADMIGRPDGTVAVNPSGTTQLALPSPDMFPRSIVDADGNVAEAPPAPADVLVDATGAAAVGPTAQELLLAARNAPRPEQPNTRPDNITPEVQAVLDLARAPQAADPLLASTALRNGPLSGLPELETPQVDVPAPERLFQGVDEADLRKARSAKNAAPEVVAAIDDELATRKAEDPLLGVRLNQDTAKLRTLPREEQVAGVQTLLDAGDARATTFDAAAALGIDLTRRGDAVEVTNADLGPAAATIPPLPPEARAQLEVAATTLDAAPITQENATKPETLAPVAPGLGGAVATTAGGAVEPASPKVPSVELASGSPVDPIFAQKWVELKPAAPKGPTAAAQRTWAHDYQPTTEAELEAKVMTELGNVDAFQTGRSASGDVTEKLAKKLGLVTDDKDMDITPKGRGVWLRTSQGLEAVVDAGRVQGYDGKQASIFERGVRSVLEGPQTGPVSDLGDLEAYTAGQIWAKEFLQKGDVRSAAETRATQEQNQGVYVGRQLEPGEEAPTNARLSGTALEQATQNRLLDTLDLRGVSDVDIATLRRAIRDGVTTDELARMAQQVQGGKTLFLQPERGPAPVLTQPDGRGQPVFREIDQSAPAPQRAQLRAETVDAVEAYRQRQLIEAARKAGKITPARAEKLHTMLDEGKVEQVANNTKRVEAELKPKAERKPRLPTPPDRLVDSTPEDLTGQPDLELEQALTGKDFNAALDEMIKRAPSRYMREIMRNVQRLAGVLQKAGHNLEFQVVYPGDMVPRRLLPAGTRAFAQILQNPPGSKVWLKSSEVSPRGTNYQVAAHEMIHAVTQNLLNLAAAGKAPAHITKATQDLRQLANAIVGHYNARQQAGTTNTFEQRYFQNEHNALANDHEILAWGLTNPEMQRYLASIAYTPKQSVFGRLVELLRGLLGLDAKYDTALTELLRVSEQLTKTSAEDIRAMFPRSDPDGFAVDEIGAPMVEQPGRTASALNDLTKAASGRASELLERFDPRQLATQERRTQTRRKLLGALTHNQIDRTWALPGSLDHSAAHRERTAVRSRFEHLGEQAYQNFEVLEKAKPQHAKWVGQLMALVTEFQVDPDKDWDEHTWIDKGTKTLSDGTVEIDAAVQAEATQIRALHRQAQKMRNDLSRGDGSGWKVYQDFRALNEAQNFTRMAVNLHSLVAQDPELSLGIEDSWVNPADIFMRADNVSTARQVRDYWSKALDEQVAAATAFVREKKGQYAEESPGSQRALREHLSPLEVEIGNTIQARKAMERAPYFHLGRFGDNFGSAKITLGADGKADPRAQRAVAAALDAAGFTDAQLSAENTQAKFMLRVKSVDDVLKLEQVVKDLVKQGHVQPDTWIGGPRNRADNYGVAEGLPLSLEALIQNVKTGSAFAVDDSMTPQEKADIHAQAAAAEQAIRDAWLESQSDTSIAKVLVKRYTVPGYSSDMIRNWAHRWRVGSIHIANMSAQPKFNAAFTTLQDQFEKAKTQDTKGAFVVQDITHELKLRDARAPVNEVADTLDKARGLAHSYFLGFSPAYGMINLTQLGVTALPELAKTHGYAKSFHAMRRASGQAIAVVRAVMAEAGKLGWKHWGDVAITDQALRAAGLDTQTRNFVTHMLATGTIDIGSMARSLGQVADAEGVGGALDTYLRLSSAVGLYTETFSRLVTALAARDLHGSFGDDAKAYAASVVSESMFDYQNWNTARYLGKQGLLGPITPIVTQFMSYQVQMLEKLYTEFGSAVGRARPGESAAQTKARAAASRTYLAGHLTAVTVLAGSLGLPFASVFANLLDRLFGDDDEPFDAAAAYRGWLASVLGQDMGEVLARGLPRAAGFDLSTRTGEQDILPFTSLLTDKRSWKEALQSNTGRSIGAVPSMIINIADGGSMIADGDVLGGLKMMVPIAFKSGVEAYRMSGDGYVDTKGNKLPLTPNASAYLWQLLGFTPAEKAEYSEARQDQMVRRGELSRRAGTLRKQMVDAMLSGDAEDQRTLAEEIMAFDAANPGQNVRGSLAGALQARQTTRQRAVALQTPLGVSMKDIGGRGLTQYANVDYSN